MPHGSFTVDEYLVEVPGPDGAGGRPVRLRIKEDSLSLPAAGLKNGESVPVHVNAKRTKAVFGQIGPTDRERRAGRKRREKEQRERGEARFKAELDER